MALYRHVTNREDLVEGIVGLAFEEIGGAPGRMLIGSST
jgi:hypothetical protein